MTTQDPIALLEKQAQSAYAEAKYQQALALYTQLLLERERELGTEHPLLVPTLTTLGEIQQTLAAYPEAEAFYRRALTLCETSYGSTDLKTANALRNVAGILEDQGQTDQAQRLYEHAVQLSEHSAPDHPDTAEALANLARFYRVTGDAEQSEALFLRAISVYEFTTGPDVRYPLAVTLNNLAFLKNSQKQYEEAEVLLRRALALNGSRRSHPSFAANLKNLATALQGRGESAFAWVQSTQAYTIFKAALGDSHPDTQVVEKQLHMLERAVKEEPMAKPTKEQFLRNPRAKELREVCLELAQLELAQTEETHYEGLKRRLMEMGITAGFQKHLEGSAYEDPVTMAEWVAGQWVAYLSENSAEMPVVKAMLGRSAILQLTDQYLGSEK